MKNDERIAECKRRFSEAASRLLSGDRAAATEADFVLAELLSLQAIERAAHRVGESTTSSTGTR